MTTAVPADQTRPSPREYAIRRELYRWLAGDVPTLPRCPACGSAIYVGDRYARSRPCAGFSSERGGDISRIDERYAGSAAVVPCPSEARRSSRYCSGHGRHHPEEPPLPHDEWGHVLRCSAALVPPWECKLAASKVD